MDEFLQYLASVENYDFTNNKFGLRGNMTEELSTIKKRFDTTKAKMQQFDIKLANTKIIRIQKLGSISVKNEDIVCKHNEDVDNKHGKNAKCNNEESIQKEQIKSHGLGEKLKIKFIPKVKKMNIGNLDLTVANCKSFYVLFICLFGFFLSGWLCCYAVCCLSFEAVAVHCFVLINIKRLFWLLSTILP